MYDTRETHGKNGWRNIVMAAALLVAVVGSAVAGGLIGQRKDRVREEGERTLSGQQTETPAAQEEPVAGPGAWQWTEDPEEQQDAGAGDVMIPGEAERFTAGFGSEVSDIPMHFVLDETGRFAVPDGWYWIVSAGDAALCMTVQNGLHENLSELILQRRLADVDTCFRDQVFYLERQEDGSYRINPSIDTPSLSSGWPPPERQFTLDVNGGEKQEGAVLELYQYHGGDGQRWLLEPVDGTDQSTLYLRSVLDLYVTAEEADTPEERRLRLCSRRGVSPDGGTDAGWREQGWRLISLIPSGLL